MSAIPCKICGGAVELPQGVTLAECPHCGSRTNFPEVSNENRGRLYNQAEYFRLQGEYDKAISVYESLRNEDHSDPEACWGLVLSRYGIEYVKDTVTQEYVPTCHRVRSESVLDDADYQKALENSTATGREIYENEAQRIAAVQKDILTIAAQENPVDVFLCCRETADGGSRTDDSFAAQKIYTQLVNAGCKVFFARISLEDKLGLLPEPYIFAALNSANVMLVIGSKKENFESAQVRNEWIRFLEMMGMDGSKQLIPCCKNMTASDLPPELSGFEHMDMDRIDFMKTLLKRVKNAEGPKIPQKKDSEADPKVVAMLQNLIVDHLTHGKWDFADAYCDQLMKLDPENGQAYIYKLMAEKQLSSEYDLIHLDGLETDKNFLQAIRVADAEVNRKLNGVLEQRAKIKEEETRKREENEKKHAEQLRRQQETMREQFIASVRRNAENIDIQIGNLEQIQDILSRCKNNHDKPEFNEIRQQFCRRLYDCAVNCQVGDPDLSEAVLALLPDMPEAVDLLHEILARELKNRGKTPGDFLKLEVQYRRQAENAHDPFFLKLADESRKIAGELSVLEIYQTAVRRMNGYCYYLAARTFERIPNYRDSAEQALLCRRRWRRNNKIFTICAILAIIVIALCNSVTIAAFLGIPACQYKKAEDLTAAGRKDAAAEWYLRAAERNHPDAQYRLALHYLEKGNWNGASEWAEKAWAQGKRLGRDQMLLTGNNLLDAKPDKAVGWFQRAAETGDAEALFLLGRCHDEGKGVKQDNAEAVKYYKEASEKGFVPAMMTLAANYSSGKGVKQDDVEAVKYYQAAAGKKNADAMYKLGECYFNGKGVKRDHETALRWYKEAAEKGHAPAMLAAGNYYYDGKRIQPDYEEAFKWYKQAAETGDAEAMCRLGVCYECGRGVERDPIEAFELYRQSVAKGYPEAMYYLGSCYAAGIGTSQNYAQAVKWFMKSAERGNPHAMYWLGVFCERGNGVKKDYAQAVKWYMKSVAKGNAQAMYRLGLCHAGGKAVKRNETEAVRYYTLAAEKGNVDAMFALGHHYADGRGVQPNDKEAFRWYAKAAELKNVAAMLTVGFWYSSGRGVQQNDKEAFKWWKLAAERGSSRAMCMTGRCFESGKGTEKDHMEAAAWYKKAADAGNVEAMHRFGYCCLTGQGEAKDPEEAFKWWKLAVEKGYPETMFSFGRLYDTGEVVKKNPALAAEFMEQAAARGYSPARDWMDRLYRSAERMFLIAQTYSAGQGVKQNHAQAVRWYRKAAEKGSAEAMVCLGQCYERGTGVKRNDAEAVKWYRLAAEKGFAEAMVCLGQCYERGTGVKQDDAEAAKWYRLAAEKGSAEAIFLIGKCYFFGKGVGQDSPSAAKWYREAAEKGSAEAMYNLAQCYHFGNGVEKNDDEALKWYKKAKEKGFFPGKKQSHPNALNVFSKKDDNADPDETVSRGLVFFAELKNNVKAAIGGKASFSRRPKFIEVGGVKAIRFFGNPDQGISYHWQPITGDAPRTVCFWFYCAGFNRHDGGNSMLSYGIKDFDRYFDIEVGRDLKVGCAWGENLIAKVRFKKWHHLAVVYDGSHKISYLDGAEQMVHTKKLRTAPSALMIGTRINDRNHCFVGGIRNVSVYDRALGAEEIRQIQRQGLK